MSKKSEKLADSDDEIEVSDLIIAETVKYYEHDIFRAKITERGQDWWIHWDSRGGFDEDVYGLTKNEFLSLMKILKFIEKGLIHEQESD